MTFFEFILGELQWCDEAQSAMRAEMVILPAPVFQNHT